MGQCEDLAAVYRSLDAQRARDLIARCNRCDPGGWRTDDPHVRCTHPGVV